MADMYPYVIAKERYDDKQARHNGGSNVHLCFIPRVRFCAGNLFVAQVLQFMTLSALMLLLLSLASSGHVPAPCMPSINLLLLKSSICHVEITRYCQIDSEYCQAKSIHTHLSPGPAG